MKMLIATPFVHDCSPVDAWEMLMRDLRDDVPRISDMPSFDDTNSTRETIYNVDAFVFRFSVDNELASQLLDSAYANCPDLVIQQEDL